MRQNISRSAQRVVREQGKDLSRLSASKNGLLAVLVIVVCVVVLMAHWPVLSAQALLFDDDQYLINNLLVQNPGLESARRFLTEVLEPSTVGGYYQPLTMLSLMADYALGGREDNLRSFHRTSLGLHVANTALVIVLLYLLFGQAPIAAGVGLLFGLHPMTVEPISWISDRKTLLSTFFALWCLILYVRLASKSDWRFYAGCLVMYVLALMSKPTSVSLPVLMLLMDYWPLGRLNRRAVLEKLPFFAVGGISAIITYVSQSRTAVAVLPGEYDPKSIPLILCHNIIFYLYKIAWPVKLSSFYASSESAALSNPMVLVGIIGTCILIPLLLISLRWTRAVLTGWLFFFVAIFPTMGVIGFTMVIAADKYAYLPSVGLLMILASLLSWFCGAGKLTVRRVAVVMTVLILAGAETVSTRRYLAHWGDTMSLFKYMLTLAPDAAPVHNMLGLAFQSQGKLDEAIGHYRQAIQISPDHVPAYCNLGNALQSQGKLDEAIGHYRQAIQFKPNYAEAHNNLGTVLKVQGRLDEAISHYRQAIQFKPNYAEAHNNLGIVLKAQGKLDEAISHYRQALQLKPDCVEAHNNLGIELHSQGKTDEAIGHYHQALRSKHDYAPAHYNLGTALQSQGKLDEAISHYRQALQAEPNYAPAHCDLGLALQSQGNLDEAIRHYRRALQLNPDDAEAHNNIGSALSVLGKFDEAISHYRQAVQAEPDFAEVHNNLGVVLIQQGKLNEAIMHFEEALQIKPDFADAQTNLDIILTQRDNSTGP